ncbi:hypothetical protein LWI29_022601 [Acer saccharum]|uniref:GH10 domain-containing protein n=1 Tax=Acer saccharum TaxID=4024 RepID=A0AA39VIT4_ACESA|nr:hypothetical protein LWI29_022601 [Acer saccharum]
MLDRWQVRKTNVRIQALDSNNKATSSNATISIKQKSPSFPFVCAMNKNISTTQPTKTVHLKVQSHFIRKRKWYSTEPSPGHEDYSVPDAMITSQTQHIAVRAHNIFWDDPNTSLDGSFAISNRSLEGGHKRITSIMSSTRTVIAWDVVNENSLELSLKAAWYEIFRVIYSKAHALDGATTLFMNDYNTIEERRPAVYAG